MMEEKGGEATWPTDRIVWPEGQLPRRLSPGGPLPRSLSPEGPLPRRLLANRYQMTKNLESAPQTNEEEGGRLST